MLHGGTERRARRLPKASRNVQPIWDITLIPFRPVLFVVLGRGNAGRYCITPVYRQAARIAPVRFIFQCAAMERFSLRRRVTHADITRDRTYVCCIRV